MKQIINTYEQGTGKLLATQEIEIEDPVLTPIEKLLAVLVERGVITFDDTRFINSDEL